MTPGVKVINFLWGEVQVGLGVDLEEECDAFLGDGGGVDLI